MKKKVLKPFDVSKTKEMEIKTSSRTKSRTVLPLPLAVEIRLSTTDVVFQHGWFLLERQLVVGNLVWKAAENVYVSVETVYRLFIRYVIYYRTCKPCNSVYDVKLWLPTCGSIYQLCTNKADSGHWNIINISSHAIFVNGTVHSS